MTEADLEVPGGETRVAGGILPKVGNSGRKAGSVDVGGVSDGSNNVIEFMDGPGGGWELEPQPPDRGTGGVDQCLWGLPRTAGSHRDCLGGQLEWGGTSRQTLKIVSGGKGADTEPEKEWPTGQSRNGTRRSQSDKVVGSRKRAHAADVFIYSENVATSLPGMGILSRNVC